MSLTFISEAIAASGIGPPTCGALACRAAHTYRCFKLTHQRLIPFMRCGAGLLFDTLEVLFKGSSRLLH
jgi:hypothetical protein